MEKILSFVKTNRHPRTLVLSQTAYHTCWQSVGEAFGVGWGWLRIGEEGGGVTWQGMDTNWTHNQVFATKPSPKSKMFLLRPWLEIQYNQLRRWKDSWGPIHQSKGLCCRFSSPLSNYLSRLQDCSVTPTGTWRPIYSLLDQQTFCKIPRVLKRCASAVSRSTTGFMA